MSQKADLVNVRNICESVAEELDYELVDVEFIKENSEYFLRIYIYTPRGITLDDCQMMSEVVGDKLDEEDPIKVSYYLEVSSPGLDRPLKTDKDFARNIGKELEINLYKALDGQKSLEGVLESFNSEELTITTESSTVINIPRQIVSLARLSVKF